MIEHLYSYNPDNKNIIIVKDKKQIDFFNKTKTYFDVSSRSYTKTCSDEEIGFMNFLLPEKAKFIPLKEKDNVTQSL